MTACVPCLRRVGCCRTGGPRPKRRRFGGAWLDSAVSRKFSECESYPSRHRRNPTDSGTPRPPNWRLRNQRPRNRVRACTRTTLIVRFTRIGHTGTRSSTHISERILRLTQNRLSGFRKPLVIVLGRGERVIRLRIRPARNRLRGSYRRSRQITRRPILQHRRKPPIQIAATINSAAIARIASVLPRA